MIPRSAHVIGSGPNGLAAAITLARAGLRVHVFERNPQLGGACSTADLTLPGFHHDLGASALPMAAASPFLRTLPLAQNGLAWSHPELPMAHPFDDGSALALTPTLESMRDLLPRADAEAWHSLFAPIVRNWEKLVADFLGPLLRIPHHPLALARFGLPALLPATTLARTRFKDERTRALLAGNAGHSVMPLTSPLCSAIALVLAGAAHTAGWPHATGGSQSLANALAAHLESLGGTLHLNHPVEALADLPPADFVFFDTSVPTLDRLAAPHLTPGFRSALHAYKRGPGIFKIDYALAEPIPWQADLCRRAGTVHVGGTLAEIEHAEAEVFAGRHPEKPFLILVQPSLADPTRAPAGQHTAWVYCHVPNGSTLDRTDAIESQIQRFAPGFRDVVLARHTHTTHQLESWNPNLLGGDLSGGAMTIKQLIFRPTIRDYGTSDPALYLCSSATAPGGGVHGMCGHNAAQMALRR